MCGPVVADIGLMTFSALGYIILEQPASLITLMSINMPTLLLFIISFMVACTITNDQHRITYGKKKYQKISSQIHVTINVTPIIIAQHKYFCDKRIKTASGKGCCHQLTSAKTTKATAAVDTTLLCVD